MAERHAITVTVNGTPHQVAVEARVHLADLLRHELGLTGTHVGCEQGVCGNCTVLVDGVAVKSCLMFAPQVDGCEVTTVEALAAGGELDALQAAFRDEHALQCGFCTPGFLMLADALARRGRRPSREELRDELAGVLCRCTGYQHVVTAVDRYLEEREEGHGDAA